MSISQTLFRLPEYKDGFGLEKERNAFNENFRKIFCSKTHQEKALIRYLLEDDFLNKGDGVELWIIPYNASLSELKDTDGNNCFVDAMNQLVKKARFKIKEVKGELKTFNLDTGVMLGDYQDLEFRLPYFYLYSKDFINDVYNKHYYDAQWTSKRMNQDVKFEKLEKWFRDNPQTILIGEMLMDEDDVMEIVKVKGVIFEEDKFFFILSDGRKVDYSSVILYNVNLLQ